MAAAPHDPSPPEAAPARRGGRAWVRGTVLTGLVLLLLSVPWATWLVYENLRASTETLSALAEPDGVRQRLERLEVALADAGVSVMRFAASGDGSEEAAYRASRERAETLLAELPDALTAGALDAEATARQGARLDTVSALAAEKFALLDEWVRFARRRDRVPLGDLEGLLAEARTLTEDTVLDAGGKRLRKRDYAAARQEADSLRAERMALLGRIEAELDAVPAAIMGLERARRARSADLAREDAAYDLAIRAVLERWFQERDYREARLVQRRKADLQAWERGMVTVAAVATALLFALGLALTALFRRGDRYERALARTLAQERALVAAREAFLANMSHEIRTPLHAIGGFAERLATRPGADGETVKQARLIGDAGRHLLDLVEHILDYARLRGQPRPPRAEALDPAALLREAAGIIGPRARDKGLELLTETAPHLPAAVRGDRLRLRQILLNLAANGVKYTDSGRVRLHATGQPMADDRFRLVYEVEDTGPGISAADQAGIFEPFRQVGAEGPREGLGLGLAICRELAQQMGGMLSVDSTPGRGSLFRLDLVLPLAAAVEESAPAGAGPSPEGLDLHVLAVDDEPFNRRLVAAQLAGIPGLTVTLAAGGEEALARFAERPADLLLLDARMPGMDGPALLAALRAKAPGIPAAALTAQAGPETEAALRAAGFDEVLCKPFGQEALEALVGRLAARRPGGPSAEGRTPAAVPPAAATEPTDGTPPADGAEPADPAEPDDPGTLDLSTLDALAAGDRTFVADMLAIFLERLDATLQEWETALDAGDRKGVAEAAHKLAAPARQLGFSELASALRALEEDADGEASLAALANRCRRLQPLLQTARLRVEARLEDQPES